MIIKKNYPNKNNPLIPLIRSCPFFSDMPISKIARLLPLFKKMELKKEATLFTQGSKSNNVYILTSGKLIGTMQFFNEDEKIVEIITPVEIVGELEVISKEARSLTVKAAMNCELLEFPGKIFIELFRQNQHNTLEVMKLISRRSVEAIRLMAKKEHYKFIVIFTNKQSLSIDLFVEQLKKNIKSFPKVVMPQHDLIESDDKKNSTTLERMMAHINQEENSRSLLRIIFIDKYETELFKFLLDNDSHFFLLAKADDHVVLDPVANEILNQLNYAKKTIHDFPLSLILVHQENIHQPKHSKHWLAKADFHMLHHVRLKDDITFQRLIRFAIGQPNGLVLSGGGMRGIAHLGVIKALIEKNIPIDIIGGVSAGSSIAAYYAMVQNYEEVLKMSIVCTRSMRSSFFLRQITLPIVSIFNGYSATKLAEEVFADQCLEDLWIPCFCLSANISTVSETVHQTGLIKQAIRSSNSVPGLMPPVVINGQLHCDGGIVNNLPVDVMRKLIGPEGRIIASQVSFLTKDNTYYSFPAHFSLKEALLYKLKLKEYRFPHFMETFLKSLLLGAAAKEKQNSLSANLLIHPNMSGFRTFKLKKGHAEKLIELGYQETIKQLEINSLEKNLPIPTDSLQKS